MHVVSCEEEFQQQQLDLLWRILDPGAHTASQVRNLPPSSLWPPAPLCSASLLQSPQRGLRPSLAPLGGFPFPWQPPHALAQAVEQPLCPWDVSAEEGGVEDNCRDTARTGLVSAWSCTAFQWSFSSL